MGEHNDQLERRRFKWNADTTTDYPVGPDDAGNAVMHGIGFLLTGWRWLGGKIANRS